MDFGEIDFAEGVFDRRHLICLMGSSLRYRKTSELVARHKPRSAGINCQTYTFKQYIIITKLPSHISPTKYGRCCAVCCWATIVESEWISYHGSIQHLRFRNLHLEMGLGITGTVMVVFNRYLREGLTSDLKFLQVTGCGESKQTRRS